MATLSTLGVFIAAEVPVCTAAVLTAVGSIYRHNRLRDEGRDTALAVQSQGLAVLVAQVAPMRHDIDHIEHRVGTLAETTAGLAATVEAHLDVAHAQRPDAIRPAPRRL